MVEIPRSSEAGEELASIMADPNTYKVSIDDRTTGWSYPGVALKQNESMWSPTLSLTESRSNHMRNLPPEVADAIGTIAAFADGMGLEVKTVEDWLYDAKGNYQFEETA